MLHGRSSPSILRSAGQRPTRERIPSAILFRRPKCLRGPIAERSRRREGLLLAVVLLEWNIGAPSLILRGSKRAIALFLLGT